MSYIYKTRGEYLAAELATCPPFIVAADIVRDRITAGVAAMYAMPVFCERFDSYACHGDTIATEFDGFTFTARLEHDSDRSIDDDDCHPAEFSAEVFGDTEDGRACFARALEARNAWLRDEWHYVGVVLSVSRAGVVLDDHAASLWGVDCNYPRECGGNNGYLTVVAQELLPEALKAARDRLATLASKCPHCGR